MITLMLSGPVFDVPEKISIRKNCNLPKNIPISARLLAVRDTRGFQAQSNATETRDEL